MNFQNNPANPLVSVILPVFNAEAYLQESIESILRQSFEDYELIIINDGSTDSSPEIIKRFAQKDRRISVITNPKPLGKAGDMAKQMGINQSKGKFIAIMDADDISKQNRLTCQIEFLEANPQVFLCGTWAEYIDDKGVPFLDWKPVTEHKRILKNLYLKNSIMHPTFFFRNEKRKTQFYETKYNWYNDYYTLFKLIKEGKVLANIPEILLSYRVSGKSTTQKSIKKKVQEYFQIKKEIAKFPPTRPKLTHRLSILSQFLVVTYLPENLVLRFHPIFRKTINT